MAQKSVGKKYEVNDELISKLDKGEVKFSDLDQETNDAVGAYLDKIEDPAASEEDHEAQPTSNEAESKQDEPAKPPKGYVEGSRFKETADKASDFENKWKAEQRKRLELEARLAEKEKPAYVPPTAEVIWSEKNQIDLHQTVQELRAKVDGFENERKQTLEEARAERLAAQNEVELAMLRSAFGKAAPKDMSMEKMEAVYSDFYYATGATAEDATNVKKYFEDSNFRKELEAKGVKPPENFEQINTILQAKAIRDKYRSVDPEFKLNDAYVHLLAKNKKLDSMFVEKQLEGAKMVADKMHNIANETITMQPGQTQAAAQDDWTDLKILDWMKRHPHPKTREEKATFANIERILDQRAAEADRGY